ncbi:acyltransferase family protein [Bradyrhizobium glycinis]|uniref:acyltransferase family protein n=1 Tax=Bradyrhizobium glycinis TaxID=2751812 RepID=UPI0018D5B63B|nr:acyltransferase [Bradyrhizobium glycinis]MBH5371736.1 acyltransferase [Bradyrhizobium glycinis]
MNAQSERSLGIDCLRGVAILWVVSYHYLNVPAGTDGVLLFFAISGYCISFSADSSKTAWEFYAKRLGRLLPALAVAVLFITAAKHAFPDLIDASRIPSWFDALYTLVALPTLNVANLQYVRPDGAFWSLEVEFQFYALCAVLIAVGLRKHLLPAICIYCFVRFLLSNPANPYSNNFLSFFIAGLSVATYRKGGVTLAAIGILAACLLEISHVLLGYKEPSAPIGWSRFAVLLMSTTALFAASQYRAPALLKPVALVGLVSYPLYLLHQDLGAMLFAWWNVAPSDVPARGTGILLFIIAAYVVYACVERPWMKPVTDALSGRRRVFAAA